jgi:hypothetical protein
MSCCFANYLLGRAGGVFGDGAIEVIGWTGVDSFSGRVDAMREAGNKKYTNSDGANGEAALFLIYHYY